MVRSEADCGSWRDKRVVEPDNIPQALTPTQYLLRDIGITTLEGFNKGLRRHNHSLSHVRRQLHGSGGESIHRRFRECRAIMGNVAW